MPKAKDACGLCGTGKDEVRLIYGSRTAVCVVCLGLCQDILYLDPERVLERVQGELERLVQYGAGPVPYSVIGRFVGLEDSRSRQLGEVLGQIVRLDHAASKPLRSSLAINKQKGRPGRTFFELCRSLGYVIPDTEQGELDFWNQQLDQLGVGL